ncbi:hypothetical protein F5Y19DRAFT_273518 [Xylariaceae sp. FL1651]|nr:hypothetical protein F5Y19DRAFT_273518 [Xylariaceae sp. FL1651]
MTEQVSGSSLPQTQDLSQHTHTHFHNIKTSHHHDHQQHHHHVRSPGTNKAHKRNKSDTVVIVETVSVLQLTDASGSTIIQTLKHDPTSAVTGSQPKPTLKGDTGSLTSSDLPYPTSDDSSGGGGGGGGDGVTNSSSVSSTIDPTATPSGSSMPTSFPTLSYSPITSTPLSAAPVFPSKAGLSNSTQASLPSSAFANSTASLHSFTTASTASDGNFSIFGGVGGTSSTSVSGGHVSSIFTYSPTGTSTSGASSSGAYFTSTAKPDGTQTDGDNGTGLPTSTAFIGGSDSGPGSTSGSGSSSSTGKTSAATIAGSVVGAISGIAFILLLAAVILRWKKRQTGVKLIQGPGNGRDYGAMATGGNGGPSGDRGISDRRRSIPFAIPAALASLSGHNRFSKSTVSSDGGERGFAKISGRKLPPVIQFGGDGYTDPRGTMMSDQSIDYRASHNFLGENPLSRLAVGSPMLQETGIPVFHASPARTAVVATDPFSDENSLESPTLPPDPLGRSHNIGSARSHGSFSRFTENL